MPHKDAEALREYHRAYRKKNRERLKAHRAAYFQANKDEHRARMRQWHKDNPGRDDQYHYAMRLRRPWFILLNSCKQRAGKKRIPFSLDHTWASKAWTGKCAITGIPFEIGLRRAGPKNRSPSIDRIKPELGYVPSNCRFVLACVNNFKHVDSDEKMYEVAKAIVNAYYFRQVLKRLPR